MATYSAVSASEKDADSPITVSLIDKLDQNPHAIAEGASGAPKIQTAGLNDACVTNAKLADDSVGTSKIADDQVTRDHMAGSAIGQTELATTLPTETSAYYASNNSSFVFTLAGGQYCFGIEIRCNTGSYAVYAGGSVTSNNTSYDGPKIAGETRDFGVTMYCQARHITASPPHKIGSLDFNAFIFVVLDSNGKIIKTWTCDDPPWYWYGPTQLRPDRTGNKGKKYKKVRILPDNFDSLPRLKQLKAKAAAPFDEIEITPDYKNSDMPLIPHPFMGDNLKTGENVLIIEPDDKVYSDLISLREQGESIAELLHDDYLRIGPESSSRDKPPGVAMHKLKWRN